MAKLFCLVVGVGAVFSVDIDFGRTVEELKKAIKKEHPTVLPFDAAQLKLYLAKDGTSWLNAKQPVVRALKRGEIPDQIKKLLLEDLPLDETARLNDDDCFGASFRPGYRDIHVFVEPPQALGHGTEDRASPSASSHSENRRKRWRELNEILDRNKKAKMNGEDETVTGYSYVRWSEVKKVLAYDTYKQTRKPIPVDEFKYLVGYLKYASKVMNGYPDESKEAKRYHFIAPVLIMLCSLFDDLKIEVEETVDGKEVHAKGHFEFVLTRGKTKICIVEAKKNDFDQGKTQALIGCEAVADLEGLYVVYGIVTDFMKWQLYRSGENSILMDYSSLSVKSGELDVESMRDVCEMIYGALSHHEDECKSEKPVRVE